MHYNYGTANPVIFIVRVLFTTYTVYVPRVHITFTLQARCTHRACTIRTRCINGACSVHASCMHSASTVHARNLHGACTAPAPCLHRALCLLHSMWRISFESNWHRCASFIFEKPSSSSKSRRRFFFVVPISKCYNLFVVPVVQNTHLKWTVQCPELNTK